MSKTSNYGKAGILDVAEFYADKFVGIGIARDYYNNPLNQFDISHARSRWFDQYIRAESTVLDFGCGSGSLSFLGAKGCHVYGIELSEEGARRALEAGYEDVFIGDISNAPEWGLFKYRTRVDLCGHGAMDDTNRVM